MMRKWILVAGFIGCGLLLGGCNTKDIIDGLVDDIQLTDEQENIVVATQIAANQGGAVGQIQLLAALSDPAFFSKSAIDTTISIQWVDYAVSAAFFTANGQEIPAPITGIVDSVAYTSTITGDTTLTNEGQAWTIGLNRAAGLQMDAVLSGNGLINGSGQDNSTHSFASSGLDLQLAMNSTFNVADAVMPLSGSSLFPSSGVLSGLAKGTLSSGNLPNKVIEIPYSVTFTGNQQAMVSINNGERTFTIDLQSGDIAGN